MGVGSQRQVYKTVVAASGIDHVVKYKSFVFLYFTVSSVPEYIKL